VDRNYKTHKLLFFLLIFLFACLSVKAQLLNQYWGHPFNSVSSLLGGAVIAGDAGNTAIYYNPASISEIKTGSNLSLAANLFSWNVYHFKNALGDGIDINTDNFLVQPQFMSFSHKPSFSKSVNISFAALTRIKEKMEMTYSNSEFIEILNAYPGEEQYNTTLDYRNDFTDFWIGGAISQQLSKRFSYGVSLFVSGATLIYSYAYSATAINSNDTLNGLHISSIAQSTYSELTKFTEYRLIIKFGMTYVLNNWKLGLTITTPTMHVFSSGKRARREQDQTNIRGKNGKLLSDFVIFDGQEKGQLNSRFKLPLSIGAGFIFNMPGRKQKLYFSAEFFAPIKGYKMVDAQINRDITSNVPVYDTMSNKDWTSFAYAANPVVNVAIGYSWALSEKLGFLNAVRTDFSSVNNADLGAYKDYNHIKTTTYNLYHYSGGVQFSIKKSSFIAGGDIAFGYHKNQKQMANFTNPVEYDPNTGRALQGPLENKMNSFFWGFSIYVAATLNFIHNQ